jgi:hypothetical protein
VDSIHVDQDKDESVALANPIICHRVTETGVGI